MAGTPRGAASNQPGELRQLLRYRLTISRGRGRFVLVQALTSGKDRQSTLSALSEISAREPFGEAMNAFRLEAVLAGGPLVNENLSQEQIAQLSAEPAVRDGLYGEGVLSRQLYNQLG